MNSNIYNNTIKDNASYININNEKDNNDIIYNDDTDRSSMETIKKILYSTDNKKSKKIKIIIILLKVHNLVDCQV